ncbi:MAG: hypothetical protein HUU57_04125 [Bdellovibrio sp.]|nr:hypothetical protein [Bdellovibrio sp.]
MNLRWIATVAIAISALALSACGGSSLSGNDYGSQPAAAEPPYYGKPTTVADGLQVKVLAKFLYRQTDFTPGGGLANGLGAVVASGNALPIPFAEFHVYDSSGTRIQQGETTTAGLADFQIPKTAGTYTLKVFSRALNSYLNISVLEDIYNNTPYSISKTFTVTSSDIASGLLDLSSSPVYAEADETLSAKLEGGAFNIMFDVLIANEYIRRNIGKNGTTAGIPTSSSNTWWVADKVTVYWKAGFNPYTYFDSGGAPLSFYSPGEKKLYILGGVNGDVKKSDTDHFDDSVILHEYGHFLEDTYGNTGSPGGSHNGNFIIDPRLAWSEGWANYFQAAVLTGADAFDAAAAETRMPTNKKYQYYVDTYGYKGSGKYGVGIAFNLAEVGTNADYDPVGTHPQNTGIFREVSIARTLYKSTRATTERYPTSLSSNFGGGLAFSSVWKAFSGEDTNGYSRTNPWAKSFNNRALYPVPNGGLFNWLLAQNGANNTEWTDILTEEKQVAHTHDYAYYLDAGTCTNVFTNAAPEATMSATDSVKRSDQQMNNDFYLYYHDGSNTTLALSYTTTDTALDLDLILYTSSYVYFEDYYVNAGYTSPYVARASRNTGTSSESISLNGLAAGFYILNVKVNMRNSPLVKTGTATYTITKNGSTTLCGKER